MIRLPQRPCQLFLPEDDIFSIPGNHEKFVHPNVLSDCFIVTASLFHETFGDGQPIECDELQMDAV